LFTDYFNSAALLSITDFASFLPMIIMAPIASKLSGKFGKKECSIVGVAIATIAYTAMFLLHLSNPIAYLVMMLIGS
ncbi:MAG: MFS transporter, partial [Ruthenibacterium sp.]